MAKIRQRAFNLANYQTGVMSIGPIDIPDVTIAIHFEIARNTAANPLIWPSESTRVQYAQDVSFDGGATWIEGGGFGAVGGRFAPDGVDVPVSSFIVGVPPGVGRLLRANIEVINGPCRTEGFVELID